MAANSNRRRVLFMASQPFFQWRGSPIRVGFDTQALSELGYEVDLLVLPIGMSVERPGVNIVRVPNFLRLRSIPIGPSISKALFDIGIFFKALTMLGRQRYDVIHAVEDTGPIGVVIAALRGSRLVFEKHSDPSSYKKGPLRNLIMALYSKAERFSIRHADACIGTGPGLTAQIRKAGGKAVHDISDIPSSQVEIDPARAAAIRAGWLRTPDDVLAAYVGSFAVYQGVDLLFEAIPQVLAGNPKVRFVVIGGTAEEIAQRREWLRARNVEDAVIFPGRIAPDALPDYLAASDILLSPRRAGVNTPLKLLDYLKAGGAIVATDLEANRLILDESNAMLTPPDAEHFAAGILRLAADAGLRKRLAEDGRKLIDRTYNYAEFKRRLGLCYEDLF